MDQSPTSPEPPLYEDSDHLDRLAAIAVSDPRALAEAIARACPADIRKHGWTPFARRLFLQVLAETGRVSTACDYAGLTKQSAYALRARDALFAAGWTAACELARAPLADALYEKALDGVTDTITKDGEVVAERHRFDSRLSIAVLHRLDKRCDRAAEQGSGHLALVRRWDEWLALVGKGDDEAAAAILETAPHGQASQLLLGESPTEDDDEDDDSVAPEDHCWKDEDGVWMTQLPPPPGFVAYEKEEYGDEGYERECTPEEVQLFEAVQAADKAQERADDEAFRDSWLERLRQSLEAGEILTTG